LRAIVGDDKCAARDHVRLLNRLRASLQITYPAALVLAAGDIGASTLLRPALWADLMTKRAAGENLSVWSGRGMRRVNQQLKPGTRSTRPEQE
jgi:hypothetical protein